MRGRIYGVIAIGVLVGAAGWCDSPPRPGAATFADYAKPAAIPYPDDNPYTAEKEALGQTLFFDPILSKSGTLSCSSCHLPSLSWGDGRARAIGEGHMPLPLRSPTLIDVAWTERLGWDGKFKTLESVAFAPLLGPANMGMTEAGVLDRLSAAPAYVQAFGMAFGGPGITRQRIEAALATYERSIVAGEAPFDRWVNGDDNAIAPPAKRGFALFAGKARCAACHSGWAFSDGSFHDIGIATGDDVGRGRLFPTSLKLQYAFKTPTLRDVERRAPYMHDGSVPNLKAVIDLYDHGGVQRPSLSEDIHPLGLTDQEKSDLIAFLGTLSSVAPSAEAPIPTR